MKAHEYVAPLLLLFLSSLRITEAYDNTTDRRALVRFRDSVVGDPQGALLSWNDSVHFCGWLGVTCGSRDPPRVTALSLGSLSLRGSITPHVGNLTFLRSISLTNNSFFGEIPFQLGRLRRLRHLDLTNNTLAGEIPASLVNCSELRTLNLMGNRLAGSIPSVLGSFPRLENLQLSINSLSGEIPRSLGNASTLRLFSAGRNNLAGKIPEEIGHLRNLELFAAPVNNLSGTIPHSIYNLTFLSFLSLAYNNLSGTLPLSFGLGLPGLEMLGFHSNRLSGPIPASISNASRLQLLDLGRNGFVGRVPSSLGNLPDLWWLDLSYNRFGSDSSGDFDFLAHLAKCKKLVILSLVSNNFGGTLPESVGNLSNQLNYLFIAGNKIRGQIPGALQNLSGLLALGIEDNDLTGEIPEFFGRFAKMQALSLPGNRFSGKIPASLGNLSQLFELDLSRNSLEGNIPPSIGDARSLKRLDFSRNRLSGEIPRRVFSLPLSLLLDLSQNALTGNLHEEVGDLKNVNAIDLSGNNLSGEIPSAIGDCSSLESLYLQGNLFDSNVPSSLASVKGLVNLDLSRNNLSGEIPRGLLDLPYLLYLNLSFNDLEGEVPSTGIFGNTSAVSLIGNSKLCGGVTALQLPKCPIKESKQKMSHGLRLAIIIVCVFAALLLLCSLLLFLYRRKPRTESSSAVSTIGSLSKVSYQTLYQVTNGFSATTLIGAGSFGTVYRGFLEEEQSEVAIKVLNLHQKGASKSFAAECNSLRTIRHRNLVKILTCCSSIDHKGNEFKALVFEYMPNGSLDKWLNPVIDEENAPMSLNLVQRLEIAIDVSCALSYLHDHCEQTIIHCDLKPSNILLDNEMVAHIGDFGLARLILATTDSSKAQTSTTGLKGTVGYAAPEYAMGGGPSRHGDVYSYGILVLEMFTGKRPTDEMFADSLNLHNFVKKALLPDRLEQVVDPALLSRASEEKANSKRGTDIRKQNRPSADLERCLISVLKIGLACSVDTPKERMVMGDVTRELQEIKNAYMGVGIHGHIGTSAT